MLRQYWYPRIRRDTATDPFTLRSTCHIAREWHVLIAGLIVHVGELISRKQFRQVEAIVADVDLSLDENALINFSASPLDRDVNSTHCINERYTSTMGEF